MLQIILWKGEIPLKLYDSEWEYVIFLQVKKKRLIGQNVPSLRHGNRKYDCR